MQYRSPDGALSAFTRVFDALWRNPGSALQHGESPLLVTRPFPDYASLHPGYKSSAWSLM
jgi:hypothetical protein